MKWILICLILSVTSGATAQESQSSADLPDPKIAFLKSIAVPGWGHHHVDHSDWRRGKYHLAAEAGFVLSYLGLTIHTDNLQENWFTYGRQETGVEIEGRSRRFQLAVGEFNTLEEYNDYQRRSRNWDQLFANTPDNRWQWSGNDKRQKYNSLRNRFERIDRQLPALLAMMAVNRIISGISAYNQAKKKMDSQQISSSFHVVPNRSSGGLMANVKVAF